MISIDEIRTIAEEACAPKACRVAGVAHTKDGTLEVMVTADAPRSMFCATRIHPMGGKGRARLEIERVAIECKATAELPPDVPVIRVGARCPCHGDRIDRIDWRAWTYRCAASIEEQLPDRAASYVSDETGRFVIRTKPNNNQENQP